VRPQLGLTGGQAKQKRICYPAAVAVRHCTVSFKDARGICHSVDVEAESLYEAVVVAVSRFRKDPWAGQLAGC
jgi:hypothetical protein